MQLPKVRQNIGLETADNGSYALIRDNTERNLRRYARRDNSGVCKKHRFRGVGDTPSFNIRFEPDAVTLCMVNEGSRHFDEMEPGGIPVSFASLMYDSSSSRVGGATRSSTDPSVSDGRKVCS